MNNVKQSYFTVLFLVWAVLPVRANELQAQHLILEAHRSSKVNFAEIKDLLSNDIKEYKQEIDSLRKLTKVEHFFIDKTKWVLDKKQIGKTFLVKVPNGVRKNENMSLEACCEFELTYLGSMTIKGIKIQFIYSVYHFGNACRASSTIRLYDDDNQEIGYFYNMGGEYSDLPFIQGSNLIIRDDELVNKTAPISFKNGIPSIFTLIVE